MSNRLWRTAAVACAALCLAVPASAQQTLNFSLGIFTPKGEDARVRGDVLVANRDFLVFDIGDFNGAAIGAEWLVPFGQFVEGGVGFQFTRRTVPSVYAGFEDPDGSEVDQDTRLRRIPIDFTVRLLPFGQNNPIQPYIGAGLTALNWRYSEFGEFIDFDRGRQIFRGDFTADGTEAGAVVVGGIRFSGDAGSAGFEVRYHKADAPLSADFAGSRLDLGGWTYSFTGGLRF
jgi:hypothetical protein